MKYNKFILILILWIFLILPLYYIVYGNTNEEKSVSSKMAILWTTAEREVALKTIFMYAKNAKKSGWWDEVQLIIWGPSSKALSVDIELQDGIKELKNAGILLTACKACSDSYGVSNVLEGLGIEVKYMGKPLTDILKSDWTLLTF